MNNSPYGETLSHILEEEQMDNRKRRRKRGCGFRAFFFIVLLLVLFFGFIYFQQYLLDLEAVAIVNAARTSTSNALNASNKLDEASKEKIIETPTKDLQQTLNEKPASDLALERTATISSQLTSVAEFQKTVTAAP